MQVNRKPTEIWTITVGYIENEDDFIPCRTVGFYINREDAVKSLNSNNADIYETCYNMAVLEKVTEGLYGLNPESVQFFLFDKEKDGYFECDKPESEYNRCGYSIG